MPNPFSFNINVSVNALLFFLKLLKKETRPDGLRVAGALPAPLGARRAAPRSEGAIPYGDLSVDLRAYRVWREKNERRTAHS